jgi:hypothetical protein
MEPVYAATREPQVMGRSVPGSFARSARKQNTMTCSQTSRKKTPFAREQSQESTVRILSSLLTAVKAPGSDSYAEGLCEAAGEYITRLDALGDLERAMYYEEAINHYQEKAKGDRKEPLTPL